MDHFSQATLFFDSMSEPEKAHIVDALRFELGKVETVAIRQRMIGILSQIDKGLAHEVAYGLGLNVPAEPEQPINHGVPADADPHDYQPISVQGSVSTSPALSMAGTVKNSIKTRKIAILLADGVDGAALKVMQKALTAEGAVVELIAPRLGQVVAADGTAVPVNKSFLTAASVLYDAVYVPGGVNSVATVAATADAVHFLNEAFKHCKAIAADAAARQVLEATYFFAKLPPADNEAAGLREGVVVSADGSVLARQFVAAIKQHRFWEREKPRKVPA